MVTTFLAVLVGVPGVSSARLAQGAGSHTPIATAARELNIHESAHLHLVSHHHEVLVEKGYGSGTLSGALTVTITLTVSGGTVSFITYPPGGTIAGRGEGSSYARGNTAYFTGTASITSGSGRYVHASARDVRIKGTLQRKTFAFFVELTAKLHY